MFKYILVSASLFASSLGAQSVSQACNVFGELGSVIIQKKEEGVPLSVMIRAVVNKADGDIRDTVESLPLIVLIYDSGFTQEKARMVMMNECAKNYN